MTTWALIVAAGSGERLGPGDPKAFRDIAGRSMLAWTLGALNGVSRIEGVVIVTPEGWVDRAVEITATYAPSVRARVVSGGATRQESVRAGLAALRDDTRRVVVHDAARPLVSSELIEGALDALEGADGAVCALPVVDTIKRGEVDRIIETVSRGDLWAAQTPQAFHVSLLRNAHERAAREGVEATDDAALLEQDGARVVLVPGDARNLKITTPGDLEIADALLRARGPGEVPLRAPAGTRAGTGYDAHGFADGRPLVIGGVTVPWDRGLAGHSDADVLSHAIADALLGAAALGDIGRYFPSSDPRWEGTASTEFLRAIAGMLERAGFDIASVDGTVVMQRPVLAPHLDEMRARIAAALGIPVDRVGVKATTTDGLGIVGRGEGAAAIAVAMLREGSRYG